jgi:hypothetical protein
MRAYVLVFDRHELAGPWTAHVGPIMARNEWLITRFNGRLRLICELCSVLSQSISIEQFAGESPWYPFLSQCSESASDRCSPGRGENLAIECCRPYVLARFCQSIN